jgi:hypothetical protein
LKQIAVLYIKSPLFSGIDPMIRIPSYLDIDAIKSNVYLLLQSLKSSALLDKCVLT